MAKPAPKDIAALRALVREMRAHGVLEYDPSTGRVLLGPAPAVASAPALDVPLVATEEDIDRILFGASSPVVLPRSLNDGVFGATKPRARSTS